MNAKHTPTPWNIESDPDVPNAGDKYNRFRIEPRIAEIFYTNDLGKANAEFIVRACNAHSELVDALKVLRKEVLNCVNDGSLPCSGILHPSMERSRLALAKAEAK